MQRCSHDGAGAETCAHLRLPFRQQYRQFHPMVCDELLHRNRRRKWRPTYRCHPAPDHRTACLRSAFYENAPVAFKRVRREEVVRRLHHRQLFLFQEPAHGHLQERSRWYVVAVENRHELAFGIFQRIVDVARFRMFMSGTGDIFHPTFCANWRNSSLPPSSRIQMFSLSFGQSIPSEA